ncbi:MAG: serine hydrolase domain-containing protein [Pseudomonadales bacterium]
MTFAKRAGLLILILIVVPFFLVRYFLGIWPLNVWAWSETATGMGAKLACSQRYVSGLGEEQVLDDLKAYASAFELLTLEYDDEQRRVVSHWPSFASQSAQFREGLGCSLEIGESNLDSLMPKRKAPLEGQWPLGQSVDTVNPAAQSALLKLYDQDVAEQQHTRALLVAKHGRIVAETYAPGIDATTPLLGWSMAKSLTAIKLGQLEYAGLLNAKEAALFPQWSNDDRRFIRLEQLLQMSSGLEFRELYVPGVDVTKMLFNTYSAASVALDKRLEHSPGEHFYYSSGTANILSLLFTQRVGGNAEAVRYFQEEILQPLGMAHTVLEPDPSGVFVGSSYAYASARDWARLGQLLLNKGELNGHRLLSADWVERATEANESTNDPRYGYQIWLNSGGDELRWPELPADTFAMTGNRSQRVVVIPSADVVIVRLGWSRGAYPDSEKFAELLERINSL